MLGQLLMMGASVGATASSLLVSDDFDRSDNTMSSAPGGTIPDGAYAGTDWALAGALGDWDIVSNQAAPTGTGTTGTVRCYKDVSGSDVDLEITIAAAPTQNSKNAGLVFRYASNANLWRFIMGRTAGGAIAWYLQKYSSSTPTTVASGTPAGMTGTLRVVANGSSIECFINGSSVTTTTDATHSTETQHGFEASWGLNTTGFSDYRFDDFTMYVAGERP